MAYAYYPVPSHSLVAPLPSTTVYMPIAGLPSEPVLSQEEYVNGEIPKTCSRCGALYLRKEDTPRACRHHVGRFMDGQQMSFWTCCKQLLRDSEGCALTSHLESDVASDQLKKFIYLTNQAESTRTITPSMLPLSTTDPNGNMMDAGSPKKKRVIRADNTPKDGVIIHTVTPTDTLDGVLLKYDISKAELIKANRGLSPSTFAAYRKIIVPAGDDTEVILTEITSPEQKRLLEEERLRIKFSRQYKVTVEEAGAYLSSNGYDYEKASDDYNADMAFEASLNKGYKSSSSSSSSKQSIFSSRSTKFPPSPKK